MKKIYIPVLAAGLLSLSSCEGFLEAENVFSKDLVSFYSNPDEISQAVAGLYLPLYSSSDDSNEYLIANYADDIVLGGGGTQKENPFYYDKFEDLTSVGAQEMWKDSYDGIFRANAIIENLTKEGATEKFAYYFNTEDALNEFVGQALGEAYFMKGYYYLRLGRWFGGVPTIYTTGADRNVDRASYLETFSVAVTCFSDAIKAFPNKPATAYSTSEYGHANKWIAQGYLARAYMHATGYLTNIEGTPTTEIPYYGTEGSLTKQDVIDALVDCRDNSGYALLADQRNLWHYAYTNTAAELYGDAAGANKLPWAKAEGLVWAGQDGFSATLQGTTGNTETMFVIRTGAGSADWKGLANTCANRQSLAFGQPGGNSGAFRGGWSYGPVHSAFYEEWSDDDLRKDGSVVSTSDPENYTATYKPTASMHYTGLISKKYSAQIIAGNQGEWGTLIYAYSGEVLNVDMKHPQLQNLADPILLRFADILLMHSELTEDATGMNKIRERAGLEPVAYSLEQLKKERLYEFNYEAIHYYDLVRWGDIYNGNNYYGKTITVKNNLQDEEYSVVPNPDQKGLHKIPEPEISLSNGLYKQNPGW